MYKVLKWHFPRKRHVDRGNWSDFSQLYGFRCFYLGVFILKNAIIVHHFLQFQVSSTWRLVTNCSGKSYCRCNLACMSWNSHSLRTYTRRLLKWRESLYFWKKLVLLCCLGCLGFFFLLPWLIIFQEQINTLAATTRPKVRLYRLYSFALTQRLNALSPTGSNS